MRPLMPEAGYAPKAIIPYGEGLGANVAVEPATRSPVAPISPPIGETIGPYQERSWWKEFTIFAYRKCGACRAR